ncbi:MAG: (d)CMP kinase [Actinomycetota bacterium]|nr:(d)CMP kinase [Actinomycetota bacterium]
MAANPSLRHLADQVRGRRPKNGSTVVVAVDGPSGSGKSTLAERLATVLDGAPIVHMDDLYPGWDGLDDAVPNLVSWVLEPLSRNETGRWNRYDWVAERYAEWHDVPSTEVLILEGVGSGGAAAVPFLDLLVWIEAPEPIRLQRGIERDGEQYRPLWRRWQLQEDQMFARDGTRRRADVILDGTRPIP